MQQVTLPGTGITTSALGFGCAHLMARIRRRESVRMLHAAYDSGVTHFDVARMYGYGEAESALGDFLQGRRDRVTVATKFGILPPRQSRVLRLAKAAARTVVALSPSLRRHIRGRAAQLSSAGHFDPVSARRSLETSLRELRTSYVDLLLLHECRPGDLADPAPLLAFLEGCVARGEVRAFGIATDLCTVRYVLAERRALAGVVQFPSDALSRDCERIRRTPGVAPAVVTHSAVGRSLPRIREQLVQSPSLAAIWSSTLGIDAGDTAALGRLLLAAAAAENPDGVVVFSSSRVAHIQANAAVDARHPAVSAQLQALRQLTGPLLTVPAAG